MNEDIEVYVDESGCFLEALIRSRALLTKSGSLLKKLDDVIEAELDLALMAAQKGKSEILKQMAKSNPLSPIKGG